MVYFVNPGSQSDEDTQHFFVVCPLSQAFNVPREAWAKLSKTEPFKLHLFASQSEANPIATW
jgi:hypothetical protein